jgi:hypothetical protein
MAPDSFFSRRPRSPRPASPPKPTKEEIAAEMSALAVRVRALGYETSAYLLDIAAFAAREGYWPPLDRE